MGTLGCKHKFQYNATRVVIINYSHKGHQLEKKKKKNDGFPSDFFGYKYSPYDKSYHTSLVHVADNSTKSIRNNNFINVALFNLVDLIILACTSSLQLKKQKTTTTLFDVYKNTFPFSSYLLGPTHAFFCH